MSSSISQIEMGTVTFTNSESETVTFSQTYVDPPFVTLTAKSEDVEVFITDLTASQMTVRLSQKLTATVDYQIFETS